MVDFATREYGDREDGFLIIYPIPPVVDKAVAMSRLGRLKRILLHEASYCTFFDTRHVVGEDSPSFSLDLSELARKYQCRRKKLQRAFDSLVISHIFVPVLGADWVINESPWIWLDHKTGSPLFRAWENEMLKAMGAWKNDNQG